MFNISNNYVFDYDYWRSNWNNIENRRNKRKEEKKMLNNVVLVGRLTRDPEKIEEGDNKCYIVVAVPRPYKNNEGVYETDFIKCTLLNLVASHVLEYCKKGDVVGVKGMIQNTTGNMEIVA